MQQPFLNRFYATITTALSGTLISLIGLVLLMLAVQDFRQSLLQHEITVQANSVTETTLAHFVPYDINLRSLYEQQSGFGTLPIGTASVPDSFGAYFVLPVENSLYLALGQYPARADGALVATFNADTLSLQKIPITNTNGNRIEEQGIHLLAHDSSNNTVVFPGTDPMQSWELGNFYSIDTNLKTGAKHRNSAGLIEVVHGWGLTISPAGNYYYGTGSYLTSVPYTTSEVAVGEVFKSGDKGLSWNRITIDPSQATSISSFLSPFRIYSLAWLNNRLYAASSNATVWHTSNEGASWEMLSGYYVDPVLTLISLNHNNGTQEFILATNQDGTNIRKINPDNSTEVFQLPFRIITGGYRHGKITTDGEWIYVLTEDLPTHRNSVYRSKDLNTWYLVDTFPAYSAVTGGKAITLAYWPLRDELLVSTDGIEAKLYSVKISSLPSSNVTPVPSLTPTATPIPAVCLSCSDPRYDHTGDGKITQEDSLWFANNCVGQIASNTCPDFDQSNGFFTSMDVLCVVGCSNPSSTPTPTQAPFPTATITPTPTPTPQNCQANPDINGSGTVDLLDISILISAFMTKGDNLPADLNCDTVVDLKDFSILILHLSL